jgi:hypothetical protein
MSSTSVILIDDKVLPDGKPRFPGDNQYAFGLNLAMLVMFNGLERREGQWKKLIERAGFGIKAIKKFTDFHDSIIIVGKK